MDRRNWSSLRIDLPVDVINRDLFQTGKKIDLLLSNVEGNREATEKVKKLIQAQRKIGQLASKYQLNLNRAYRKADKHKKAGKEAIKLVDAHIRFYRFGEIEEKMNKLTGGASNTYDEAAIQQIKKSLQSFADVIYQSIDETNQQYVEPEDADKKIAYLVNLAFQTDIAMRYYAKHMKNEEEGDFVNYYDILERGAAEREIERIENKQEDSFINEAYENIEDTLDEIDDHGI